MSTVHVSNISPKTSEKEIKDFFSFCGKITHISVTPSSGAENATLTAAVTFERQSAAKTAELLDNTQLGDHAVKVESSTSSDDTTSGDHPTSEDPDTKDIRQEDKPRNVVLAEYLSQGYVIGDNVLQKALELDATHGIVAKFSDYLKSLDARSGATDKAKAMDSAYDVTGKAQAGFNALSRYFESAINTPTGQKVRAYYDTGAQQVLDIHAEARRLADLKKVQTCTCGGNEGKCQCPDGKCTCDNCPKAKENENVSTCGCGGSAGQCTCPGDKCVCKDCAKHKDTDNKKNVSTCGCGGSAGKCTCPEGKCVCKDCAKHHNTHESHASSSNAPPSYSDHGFEKSGFEDEKAHH